ncbi:hypothetical protein [Bifidobacterium catulorum]|uniref:Uncharacterized protein n=1 Tax=Bifidobacterium catulorum TaxID=1630173 RepID=A0A2U2MTU9_9BIFI|nr:hypothetical protein [Bifidobacterium catulorum]PWG60287.1 hypothetical protein DF200_03550 [Bifidobacterium catulorum]
MSIFIAVSLTTVFYIVIAVLLLVLGGLGWFFSTPTGETTTNVINWALTSGVTVVTFIIIYSLLLAAHIRWCGFIMRKIKPVMTSPMTFVLSSAVFTIAVTPIPVVINGLIPEDFPLFIHIAAFILAAFCWMVPMGIFLADARYKAKAIQRQQHTERR